MLGWAREDMLLLVDELTLLGTEREHGKLVKRAYSHSES